MKLAGSCSSSSSGTSMEYKLPLVWIHLEMTGLNVEVDRILEIACVITDGKLIKSVEGPDLVIHQTEECLDEIGDWCQSHQTASGLKKRVLQSTISEREAEKQVIEFVKSNIGAYTPNLAGNSVYVDVQFLKFRSRLHKPISGSEIIGKSKNKDRTPLLCDIVMHEPFNRSQTQGRNIYHLPPPNKYMPDLAGIFSHVLVDVSSVRALCCRWYPKDYKRRPSSKEKEHGAMDDIKESIEELKFYKETIFKPKSGK